MTQEERKALAEEDSCSAAIRWARERGPRRWITSDVQDAFMAGAAWASSAPAAPVQPSSLGAPASGQPLGWSCYWAARKMQEKAGPGRCSKWCGNKDKCPAGEPEPCSVCGLVGSKCEFFPNCAGHPDYLPPTFGQDEDEEPRYFGAKK